MSFFNNTILRPFYRLFKTYTEDLLRKTEDRVEKQVDKIDSRASRTTLVRREWKKEINAIREWSASRIKKETHCLVKWAAGKRGQPTEAREKLDGMLSLARCYYIMDINQVAVKQADMGTTPLETFLAYYLEKVVQDDMVSSRQFLNSSVSDRKAVVQSCMTDAVEETIPASVHRLILAQKSNRKRKDNDPTTLEVSTPKQDKPESKPESNQDKSTPTEDSPTSAVRSEEKEKATSPKCPPPPPPKKQRRVKEVMLKSNDAPTQMDLMRRRLQMMEERDQKIREGVFEASGQATEFDLNTDLSNFM